MNKKKNSVYIIGFIFLLIGQGCDKKNNPLIAAAPAGLTALSVAIPQIDTVGTFENRVFVAVQDQNSNAITGLQMGNFTLLEGGNPGIHHEVGDVTDPLYLALAIDRSGSMGTTGTAAANAAAVDLINALSAADSAALIEFESTVSVTLNFTTNKTALINAINAGVASGATAFYDSIVKSAELLQNVAGRRLLIVLTDGADNSSSNSLTQTIASVNDKGMSAYTVGLGSGFETAILQQIADETGGTFNSSASGSNLSAIFLGILDRFSGLSYVKYRRRNNGAITVYATVGSISASASKSFD